MLAEIEAEIRLEEPSFEGYEAFVTSEDPEVRCSDEAFDILEDATLFIAREKVERRLHPKFTEDGTDITDHDEYERTLLSSLACAWFNQYEKPIFGYGGVFIEGIGCSLDQTGCKVEERRLAETRRKCLNSNEPDCEEETVQWTDVYWKRHSIRPGSPEKPNVIPVRLSQPMCLTDQFRSDMETCHGEAHEWDEGQSRHKRVSENVKGQWNNTLKLCSYSGAYCDSQALETKIHKHNHNINLGEKALVQTCVMLPGQKFMEMLFGQYTVRLFTSTLATIRSVNNPKQAMRDWKSGKYPMGAILYYGMGVGVIANFANMVTNPGKYFRNKGFKWEKMQIKLGELSRAVSIDFKALGNSIEKYIAKIPLMAGVTYIVGQIIKSIENLPAYGSAVVGGISDVVGSFGDAFEKYVWDPAADFFKGLF
jgi:hypothetical protein